MSPRSCVVRADVAGEEDDAAQPSPRPSGATHSGRPVGADEAREQAGGGEPLDARPASHPLTEPAVRLKAILRCTRTKKMTTGIATSVEPAIRPPQSVFRLVP